MSSFVRATLVAVLAAFAFAAAPVEAKPRAAPIWPQDVSDLRPDPGVKYGVLPNGLRYAIMHNAQPAGIASIRLRIDAGSLGESDNITGLAHFLEHMAFNGSDHVPEGDLVKLLQRTGLAFGPDINASTSFGETLYMLDLPQTDEKTVDTGLFIMRETASHLLLEQGAVDRERGVILSEERRRDSPEYRVLKKRFEFWLKGQPLPTRWPIGTQEVIRRVSSDDFKTFYHANYRPEKALLVVVGDIDVARIEAKIRDKFSDWTQPGAASPKPNYGVLVTRGPQAAHQVEPGLPASVSVTWVTPAEHINDTMAHDRLEVVRAIGYAVINRRLQRIARQPDAPFISADVSRSDIEHSATLAGLDVSVRPGQWKTGMAASEQVLRQALRYGVTQAEVDREVSEYRAGYQAAAAGAATRDTRQLAGAIPGAFADNEVFVHPSTALEIFNTATANLTAASVSNALRTVFRGQGPLVFVSGAEAIEGGDAAILAAYRASAATPVAKPAAESATPFAYGDFGAPGVVAERAHNAEFDFDTIRFANGVRLTLKKTPYEEKRIAVAVRLRGGLAYEADAKTGLAILSPFVMGEGGLGKMTTEELERATAGRILGASFDFGEDDFTFVGKTRPEDLTLELQLLAASVTDPGFRPDGLVRIQQAAENFIQQYATAPDRVLDRDSGAIVRRHDARWEFPSLAQVRALGIDDFKSAIAGALRTRPLEISIVGDFNMDEAIRTVARRPSLPSVLWRQRFLSEVGETGPRHVALSN